jgi:hypothetical protein
MRKPLLAIAVLTVLAVAVWYRYPDRDHLSPEDSGMTNGLPVTPEAQQTFKPFLTGDILVSVIGDDGGLRHPFLIGVRRNGVSYEIFGAVIQSKGEVFFGRVQPCSVTIAEGLARKIVTVWQAMLRQTRRNLHNEVMLDGGTFHFFAMVGSQKQTGRSWDRESDSKVGRLIDVSRQMEAACQEKQLGKIADLERQVGALLDLL